MLSPYHLRQIAGKGDRTKKHLNKYYYTKQISASKEKRKKVNGKIAL